MRKDPKKFIEDRVRANIQFHFSLDIKESLLKEIEDTCISILSEIVDEYDRALEDSYRFAESTVKHYQRIIDRQSIKIQNLHEHYRERRKHD